jgi:hypothetical protein
LTEHNPESGPAGVDKTPAGPFPLSTCFAQDMTMTRWFESARESHHDPVWKTGKGGT